jgi:tetratricopeptide (TPR) repeat protein
MAPLLRICDLDLWDDQRIGAGEDWFAKIEEALNAASLAILLLSPDFLSSKFITEVEVPRLLERRFGEGLRFFPILVRKCNFELYPWLAQMEIRPQKAQTLALKSDPEIDVALTEIVKEMHGILNPVSLPPAAAGFVPMPPKIYTSKLPSTVPILFGRDDALEQLDRTWDNPLCHILELVAFGGVGKTSLVNNWLLGMAEKDFRGATWVYAESFYSQGAKEGGQASADTFIATALKDFGDQDPNLSSPWDKGRRLADLMRRERTLLILDGLEPLQFPAGEMKGRLKDPALETLLKELAVSNPGLVIITTRLEVAELQGYTQSRDPAKDPPVTVIDLENLSEEAGADLLEHLGVNGQRREMEEAAGEFRGHALALTLLGKYLVVVHEGDIRRRDEIPALSDEEEEGGHARRVMRAYEIWLKDRPELLEILRIMGLFDRPAEAGAIKAVRKAPAIEGLTSHLAKLPKEKWRYALKALRDLRLLDAFAPHNPYSLDCHPLVREYFGERLQKENPKAWKTGHSRLYEYHKSVAKKLPETVAELAPLYAAVVHGCRAGRHQEALGDVYMRRILQGNQFVSSKKLGALSADLTALAAFFDPPWETPAASLTPFDQSFILNQAGYRLWGLGRLQEALDPLQTALDRAIAREDWGNATAAANNLTNLTVELGELERAEALARQTLDLAESSGEKYKILVSQCFLAYALHQMGAQQEAGELFRQAEALQKESQPREPYLYSFRGFQFCDLLLDQGLYQEVLARMANIIKIAQRNQLLQDIGLDHLSLGEAYLAQGLDESERNLGKAAEHLSEAVDFLRRAGMQHFLALGLLGRAGFFRANRDWPQGHRDLEEALEMCQRSGMRLYEADCHLEYARLYLAQGNKEEARRSLAVAKPMIQQMGYHRRDREVEELEAQLSETS